MAKKEFEKWLNTFVDEKGLDRDYEFKVPDHPIYGAVVGLTLDIVIKALVGAPADIQKKVKDKLVLIDYANGDVMHFFQYIAEFYNAK
jgi:hypothetical protein